MTPEPLPRPSGVTFSPSFTLRNAVDWAGHSVCLMVCDVCGALVMHDSRDDGALMELHAKWHEGLRHAGS